MPEIGAAFDFEQLEAPPAPEPVPSLSSVEVRAREILAAAEAHAEQARAQAARAGFEEGYADGRAAALAELRPTAEALAGALQALGEAHARAAQEIEREAVALAIAIAEKVVAGAIDADQRRVVDVITGALRTMLDRERIVIAVNPQDLETVREALGELSSTLGGIGHIEVQEERRIARGGALVRTPVGEIDATIETKLARVRELVAGDGGAAEPAA